MRMGGIFIGHVPRSACDTFELNQKRSPANPKSVFIFYLNLHCICDEVMQIFGYLFQ